MGAEVEAVLAGEGRPEQRRRLCQAAVVVDAAFATMLVGFLILKFVI